MPAAVISSYVGVAFGVLIVVSLLTIPWIPWGDMKRFVKRRTDRRGLAPRGREHFIDLDGAVELEQTNGTITTMARDAAHNAQHATEDDTATGATSGNANGTASEPH